LVVVLDALRVRGRREGTEVEAGAVMRHNNGVVGLR